MVPSLSPSLSLSLSVCFSWCFYSQRILFSLFIQHYWFLCRRDNPHPHCITSECQPSFRVSYCFDNYYYYVISSSPPPSLSLSLSLSLPLSLFLSPSPSLSSSEMCLSYSQRLYDQNNNFISVVLVFRVLRPLRLWRVEGLFVRTSDERERESLCMCVYMVLWERERERVSLYVCVYAKGVKNLISYY